MNECYFLKLRNWTSPTEAYLGLAVSLQKYLLCSASATEAFIIGGWRQNWSWSKMLLLAVTFNASVSH